MEKLKKISLELSSLEEQYSRLTWVQYTTGFDMGVEQTYKQIVDKYCNTSDFEYVKKTYLRSDLDPKSKREAEILYKGYEPYHLSKEVNDLSIQISNLTTKLSSVLNTFRSKIDGVEVSSVEIAQILRNEEDREKRKKAYFSKCQINKPLVDAGFLELIKLRKQYAKLRGFNDFVEMKLSDDELNAQIFSTWKDELHTMLPKIKSTRERVAKKYLNYDKIMPWDEAYLVSKMAPSLSKRVDMSDYFNTLRNFFLNFGIDLSTYNITYDLFPRANKSEWGYNFPIATRKDSRILANVKNQYNEYGVLLHETGHAVHSFIQDPNEDILNRGISGIITEGIANLFGSFLSDEVFIKQFFDNPKEIKEELKEFKEFTKINALGAITNIMFDQNIYRNELNSLQDINNLAISTLKEYMDDDFEGTEYPWGVRIHHTTHPIYLHNYFMGDVTCEMLRKTFIKKYNCENIMEKPVEFAQFLIKSVIEPSGLYKYPELFKRISGEDFSLKYML
ncbi:peptidase M3A and M3B thimet/oligopeptidase F [Sedimentibacter sp. zth1]|uniref:M3 family metallopeptidase n=1 Tax=Sedimentibacter sp. zth1 TaxID=2816908 RepID=UPI001A92F46A|nr:M3 family metallopeptidase [Sedimentibacter sp. zth1]QSX05782.1 peptidase M3A and M3B thimet/oligopeptidase F [Sedimentibacter sp. zth1]